MKHYAKFLIGKGHKVIFITDSEHKNLEEFSDLEGLNIRTKSFPKISEETNLIMSMLEQGTRVRQLNQIWSVGSEEDVDVMHLLYFDRTQIPFLIATKLMLLSEIPTVATLHRDIFTQEFDSTLSELISQTAIFCLSEIIHTLDSFNIVVHSKSIQDRVISEVPNASQKTVKLLPAPTQTVDRMLDCNKLDQSTLASDTTTTLLFFGELREEKGPDILFEALAETDHEVRIVLAGGTGEYTQREVLDWIDKLPENVGVNKNLSYIPENKVYSYFVAADILVLPYRRQRGISGPLRRACMVGTPVIGPQESDIGEIIDRHQIGWTFELGSPDSLLKTISQAIREGKSNKSANAKEYGQTCSLDTAGSELESLYRDMICTEHE